MIEQHYGGSKGFWDFLKERDNDNCLMGCSIKGYGKEGQLMIEGKPCGLILNHAYSLNDIIEFKDRFDKTGQNTITLLRLRNPWGKSEWKNAWSDKSEERQKYKQDIDDYINSLPPDEKFDPEADDGTFLMHYDDWKDNFSTLFLNIDFPEDWTGVRFKSAWTKSNSGGLPNPVEKENLERYAKNP